MVSTCCIEMLEKENHRITTPLIAVHQLDLTLRTSTHHLPGFTHNKQSHLVLFLISKTMEKGKLYHQQDYQLM